MPFKITDMYVFYRILQHIQQIGDIPQRHGLKQVYDIMCKTMGIAATAGGKRNPFLLVIGTLGIHALVTLYFHTDYRLLTTDRKANKIPDSIAVLDQMRMTA